VVFHQFGGPALASRQPLHLPEHRRATVREPQKIGISNKQKWCGYLVANTLFEKHFDYRTGVEYPDYGCNNETYTTRNYMEVESLGPLHNLAPGGSAEHVEQWFLFRDVKVDDDEESLNAAIRPLIAELNLRTDKQEDNQ
jgi:hypothetical protein